jgi:hypothetical protein
MIILSWNIEHYRYEKITRIQPLPQLAARADGRRVVRGKRPLRENQISNMRTFYGMLKQCDIAFIYEAHHPKDEADILEALNDADGIGALTDADETAFAVFKWKGMFLHSTDEWIACLWKKTRIKSVVLNKSKTGEIKTISPGERLPVVVDVTSASDEVLTLAAWHSRGPAVQNVSDIISRLCAVEGIDIMFGDANFESPMVLRKKDKEAYKQKVAEGVVVKPSFGRQTSAFSFDYKAEKTDDQPDTNLLPASEVGPVNYRALTERRALGFARTSTYTDKGPTHRQYPLDRVWARKGLDITVIQPNPVDDAFTKAAALTNHCPLFIITGEDRST